MKTKRIHQVRKRRPSPLKLRTLTKSTCWMSHLQRWTLLRRKKRHLILLGIRIISLLIRTLTKKMKVMIIHQDSVSNQEITCLKPTRKYMSLITNKNHQKLPRLIINTSLLFHLVVIVVMNLAMKVTSSCSRRLNQALGNVVLALRSVVKIQITEFLLIIRQRLPLKQMAVSSTISLMAYLAKILIKKSKNK